MKIGFFGLGNMGLPMAKNLVKKGHKVIGYDVVPSALEKFRSAGGESSQSIKEASTNVDIIISMLPSGTISKKLYCDPDGILNHASNSTLLIDCSTISPTDAKYLGRMALEKKFNMIDAPVSGGVAGADAGTLTFIVGGEKEDMEKAKPILLDMGKNVFHAGDSGSGQVAKVCNNMLLAIHMIGTCEALTLGVKNGMDPKVLSEIMKSSSGDNWSLQKYNPFPGVMENVPSSKEYQGGFMVNLMIKDLLLANEAAKDSETNTPLGVHSLGLYEKHRDEGNGNLDFSSIIKLLN